MASALVTGEATASTHLMDDCSKFPVPPVWASPLRAGRAVLFPPSPRRPPRKSAPFHRVPGCERVPLPPDTRNRPRTPGIPYFLSLPISVTFRSPSDKLDKQKWQEWTFKKATGIMSKVTVSFWAAGASRFSEIILNFDCPSLKHGEW